MIITKNLIPVGKVIKMGTNTITRRPGKKMDPTSITIHNTGNASSTALNECSWLVNPKNMRSASWHYCIDAKYIVQAIPDNEVAYHAGKAEGNNTSIGIEICESGNFEETFKIAAKFVAEKLIEHNLTPMHVTTHKRWSGKECPRLIIPRWTEFMNRVTNEYNALKGGPTDRLVENLYMASALSDKVLWKRYLKGEVPVKPEHLVAFCENVVKLIK